MRLRWAKGGVDDRDKSVSFVAGATPRRSISSLEAMINGPVTAHRWTQFLASRTYVPKSAQLLAQFAHGEITRFCQCGCNSYDLRVAPDVWLEPLMPASDRSGCALELAFYTAEQSEPKRTVEINLYIDSNGYFAGIDVDYCGNSAPMPEHPVLIEPPFHIHGALLSGL